MTRFFLLRKRPKYVRSRVFRSIADRYPEPGHTKSELLRNITYTKQELTRWYNSMCFANDVIGSLDELEDFEQAWRLLQESVTDDNAFHVQRMLESAMLVIRPFALRIIYTLTDRLELASAIAVSRLIIVDGLLELDALTNSDNWQMAKVLRLASRERLLLGNIPHYRKTYVTWTREDIKLEETTYKDEAERKFPARGEDSQLEVKGESLEK